MIRKANINWSAKQTAKSIDKGTIIFDNIIQRTLVWTNKNKSLLIHSMIIGFPMGPIFAQKNEGKYDVLDGKQRLNTIYEFIHDKFALTDIPTETEVEMDYGMDVVDLNGMKWSDLPESVRETINDYSLTVYYFDSLTDEETNEMFYRLNNGKPLSAIELTRARAKSLAIVREIAQHELFTSSLTSAALAKYANEDIVMKSWVLLKNKESDLSTKTVREQMETEDWSEEDKAQLKQIYDVIFSAYNSEENKKVKKKIATRIHLISLVPVLAEALKSGFCDKEDLISWVHMFFGDTNEASISEEYNEFVKSGSARKEAVVARYEAMENNLKEYMNERK